MYLENACPDFIVKTLIRAGFDSALSLLEIEESDIVNIQNYAADKCQHLIELDTVNGEPKLKPGHRKLILAISNKAKQFLQEKTSAKNDQENTVLEVRTEEIELLSPDEINVLKENLISKLNACARNNGLNIEFTQDEISRIDPYISKARSTITKSSYKCFVKCVLCSKSVPCTHNGHWQTSNLEKHLKKEANALQSSSQEIHKNSQNALELQAVLNK